MSDPSAIQAELLAMLGTAGCLTEPHDCAPFETDFRGLFTGKALAVLKPASVDEVQAIMRLAQRHCLSVVPAGGNTSYCGGATPDASGRQLVLSLARLNRIRSLDAAGFTLTAEAGCTLEQIQQQAHAAQRRFPLSLGSQGSCQIGGNVATNAGGTSVLRFGMMRDLVLGLEVVLADGSLLNQLAGLRKDNTGYDVKQLFIGAEGTLGVITAVTVKLFPEPHDYCTAMIGLPHIGSAVQLLAELRAQFGDVVESFEFLPESACALAREHLNIRDPLAQAPPPARVLIELAVPPAWTNLAEQLSEFLMNQSNGELAQAVVIARSEQERQLFWELRERIPEAQTKAGASIKHDISLPLHALQAFVDTAQAMVLDRLPNARIINYGHVGDGNLHYNISPPLGTTRGSTAEDEFKSSQATITRQIHDLVAKLGGSFSAEHGIGQLKCQELARYEDPTALSLMRQLKTSLDPDNRLNPGKVVPLK
jgi:FAD/FMN-containing dehydrogenase